MAKTSGGESSRAATPSRVAQSLPPETAGSHSFLLQAIFDLKGSFSRVEEKVDRLSNCVETLETKVETINSQLTFVRGAMWVIAGLFGLVVLTVGWWITGDMRLKIERGGVEPAAIAQPASVAPPVQPAPPSTN